MKSYGKIRQRYTIDTNHPTVFEKKTKDLHCPAQFAAKFIFFFRFSLIYRSLA